MRRASTAVIALVALLAITVLGVHLRLQDPLSTDALGAEDPYSHVVFTKESLDEGAFGDSFHLGTRMYPPGLHALLGALAPASGVDLHEFARFLPVVFGALAIVGTYALAARLGGLAAGVAAALLVAVMPEHVFRTNLLFPTALDLALLPALLLAFVLAWDAARRERSLLPRHAATWSAAALFALLAVPLAFTHPWVVPLFLAPAALFVALRTLREAADARAALRGLCLPAALAVAATAFAMAFRWDESDTGFADFFAAIPGLSLLSRLDLPGALLFAALLAALGALAALAILLVARALRLRRRLTPLARFGAGALLAALLVALALRMGSGELPPDVHYAAMLGRPAVWLALAGVIVAMLRPTPLGDLALAVSVVLFPLTAVNVFDSPFWPQRTVAYLSIGVALLAGAAAAFAHDAAHAFLVSRARRARLPAAPVALAGSLLLVAGAVAAAPASTYEWYRLYPDAHFKGFQHVAGLLEEGPEARVVVHGWQPGLLLKALGDPGQVRYAPEFFNASAAREKVLDETEGPTYVLVDKYLLKGAARGEFDLSFLDGRMPALQTRDGKFLLYLIKEGDDR